MNDWVNSDELGEIAKVLDESTLESRRAVLASIISSQKLSCERLRDGLTAKLQIFSIEQGIV